MAHYKATEEDPIYAPDLLRAKADMPIWDTERPRLVSLEPQAIHIVSR